MPRPKNIRTRRRPRGRQAQGKGDLWKALGNGASWLLGKGIRSLITGFGDYKVESNTLMKGGLDPPTVVNSVGEGNVIVRHREYLMDISATTVFTVETLPINPGMVQTFPWLSAIAQHFEQYKMRGLLFEFKSLSSDSVLSSATSSALGSVVMATQYNVLNPVFPDKFTMENYEFANSSKPSIGFLHPVECARSGTPISELFIRSGNPFAGSDLRLYDLGTFNIATVGMQAASGVAGELWCTYEIELLKPRISSEIDVSEYVDHFLLSTSATNANPFTAAVRSSTSTLGGTVNGATYTFPPQITDGLYLAVFSAVGGSTSVTGPTWALTNCLANLLFRNNTVSNVEIPTGTTTTTYLAVQALVVTSTNASFALNSGVYPTSITSGDFLVIQLPAALTALMEVTTKICPIDLCPTHTPTTDSDEDDSNLNERLFFLENLVSKLGLI